MTFDSLKLKLSGMTSWLLASVLDTRQAGGYLRALKQHIESAYCFDWLLNSSTFFDETSNSHFRG